jgi:hypothetical protein
VKNYEALYPFDLSSAFLIFLFGSCFDLVATIAAATLPASPSISVFQFLVSWFESLAVVSHPLPPD